METPHSLKAIEGDLKLSEITPKEIMTTTAALTGAFGLGLGGAHLFPKIFS